MTSNPVAVTTLGSSFPPARPPAHSAPRWQRISPQASAGAPAPHRPPGGRTMKALNRILSVEMTVFEFLGWLFLAGFLFGAGQFTVALLARLARPLRKTTEGLP